jgi:hypothetical protein
MSDQQFTNITDPRFGIWRKSTRSQGTGNCVAVSSAADGTGAVAVADTKAGPEGPTQVYGREAWTAFLAGAKSGAFDRI